MEKKVAVVAVNPVNGLGLFQYLEAFYENQIPYTVFAVADSTAIKTNSGIALTADDVIANLKGKEDQYDAVVFSCGDAIPVFAQNAGKSYNQDMLAVLTAFGEKGKIIIGHCAAAFLLDSTGAITGKKVATHPFVKTAIQKAIPTDAPFETDGNIYTAQTENTLHLLIPEVIKVLKG